MKAALLREGTHPAAGSTLGHGARRRDGADPSSVDEVDRRDVRAADARRDDHPSRARAG